MATIQVTVSPEELLQIVDQMPADELVDFTDRVLAVKARRTAATLDAGEESILRAVYAAQLPPDQQQRLRTLAHMLEAAEVLSADEQRELQTLTEQAEGLNAVRIEKVAQLAVLWGKPLPAVMKQLGLWRSDDE